MAELNINEDWLNILDGSFNLFKTWRSRILHAFEFTSFENVKVVIIGEETWWWWKNRGEEDEISPSMENIFVELQSDFRHTPASYKCLKSWSKQGVLLLDAIQPDNDESAMKWDNCIDNIIMKLNERLKPIVFILWGDLVQSKSNFINSEIHLVLTARHPVSNDTDMNLIKFSGSKPFSTANQWLKDHGETAIDWRMPYVTNDWQDVLEDVFLKENFQQLQAFLDEEYASENKVIYINPDRRLIFKALELTPFENVKVVIMGNDPPTGRGQASGVAFSVDFGKEIPPTITLIIDKLRETYHDQPAVNHGCLESWAKEGVLLLNAVLTIRLPKYNFQSKRYHRTAVNNAWVNFTDAIIEKLNERENPIVFILMGKCPNDKGYIITSKHHGIIRTDHPVHQKYKKEYKYYSEHQIPFESSKPFSEANDWLEKQGEKPINWKLEDIQVGKEIE